MSLEIIVSFLSLSGLEIVLGIDNVVFIALVVGHLPPEKRRSARVIGLTLAMVMRIFFLLGIVWIMGLQKPLFTLFERGFSLKDVMMFGGGLFLIAKATSSIHEQMTGDDTQVLKEFKGGFYSTILQIIFIDLIFSFDSVMTAVGIVHNVWVIVAAMVLAMVVMLAASGVISEFITRHPTLKMLALAFIMMVGVFLMGEGLGLSIPKGYIYFGMAFSLGVETLNLISQGKRKKASLRLPGKGSGVD